MPDPASYELAYVEARRALQSQYDELNHLSTRAGVLIAAAAVSTSFFGGATLSDGRLGAIGWVAVLAFVLLGVALLTILWPRLVWTFAVDAEDYIETYLESETLEPLDLPGIHRDLALHMAASFRTNGRRLRELVATFRLAVVLLVIEVLAWTLALVAQGS